MPNTATAERAVVEINKLFLLVFFSSSLTLLIKLFRSTLTLDVPDRILECPSLPFPLKQIFFSALTDPLNHYLKISQSSTLIKTAKNSKDNAQNGSFKSNWEFYKLQVVTFLLT